MRLQSLSIGRYAARRTVGKHTGYLKKIRPVCGYRISGVERAVFCRITRMDKGLFDMKKKILKDAQQKGNVLIIEDNMMNREILCDLLEDDFDVLEADNGISGLEQLENHKGGVDAILLDVFMPVMDGFGFLEEKQRRKQFDSIPVIVMTASNTVDDEIRCLSLGATDFVTKPYNVEVLKNRLRSVIRFRQSASMLNRLEIDSSTQLYSKEFFYQNVEEVLAAYPDRQYDIVCSDVMNFRALNEHYGQARCDAFLSNLAEHIPSLLPGYCFGGRIGADVFAFLIEHQETEDWSAVLENDRSLSIFSSSISVKYGIIPNVDHSLPASASCDRATLALNRIKSRFNQSVAWYDDEIRRTQMLEHQLADNMLTSLEKREFQVYYQPKHDIHKDHTGGAEALVRWIHPELGFISPGLFIPLFERNGFVTKLDFFIWEEVCRELKRCRDENLPQVPVSVNVSRMDFDIPDLAQQIIDLADRYEVDHSMLHIELTESIYGDNPERIADTLEKLHNSGFIIELDDFGAGYSSLASLNTLKLDVLKLDMSLIRRATATKDYSMLRFCVLLAETMRMKTVVEGVETSDQVAALKVLGCDYIQGYYYSKPIPTKDFESYLMEHSA